MQALDAGFFHSLALVCRPEAPSSLTAAGMSSSQIDLYWTDNSEIETGFKPTSLGQFRNPKKLAA